MRLGTQLSDSGLVAAGAIINTVVLDVRTITDLLVIVTNSDGAATRALTMTIYTADGNTALATLAVRTVAISATETIHIGPCAVATGITAVSCLPLPCKVKLTLAAAGSS